MNFTNFPQFVVSVLLLSISYNGIAQDKKVATILYNTKPVEAQIDTKSKSIDYIIRENDEYLSGFKLQIPDYEQFLLNDKTQKETTPQSIANSSNSQKVIAPAAPAPVMAKPTGFESGAFTFVMFSDGFATLSDAAILVLESVISELNKNHQNLTLKTFSTSKEDVLAINRANAVKTYLKIRGVNTENIEIIHLIGEINIPEVSVSFIK